MKSLIFLRQQTEQDVKNFSQDVVVTGIDDPQQILEEEAKALAQFNKVSSAFDFRNFQEQSLEKRNNFATTTNEYWCGFLLLVQTGI